MKSFINALVSVILAVTFFFGFWVILDHDYDWAAIAPYSGNLFSGWLVTVGISLAALALSVVVAAVLTAAQLSSHWVPRVLSRAYVEIIRGTPLLTQILIGYYLIADAIGWDSRFGGY